MKKLLLSFWMATAFLGLTSSSEKAFASVEAKGKNMGKKIAIIGNAGSGKSTLGFELHKKLGIPLYHLDQYQWKPNYERVDRDEFEAIHNQLCDKESWIIEGLAIRLFAHRIEKADIIIFLNIPTRTCLWRVIKRAVCNWGKVIPGNPEGCKQHIFTRKFLEFLQWIWSFDKRYKNDILKQLNEVKDKKHVYVIQTAQEAKELVVKIK